ncbi:hypothetical protein N8I77_008604 [Diaporthe amygdali]|uniref:Uncharacterized protein n=1 Tax=Phomopsis amygdali TaxID=1214568 RepID=A0AAD9SFI3_PHOAM|nr:hypothetical protein N8I77_008604 [Diaporthe amygdali]
MKFSYSLKLFWTGLSSLGLVIGSPFHNNLVFPRQISTSELLPDYDYIIVGGGTAGLTVADRLTEDPTINVLVLEAGGWGNQTMILAVHIPADENLDANYDAFWPNVTSLPQARLNGRVNHLRIGMAVGGSSAVNGMYAMRGSAEDYDRWGALFGTHAAHSGPADWTWEGILPYFKKALRLSPPIPALVEEFDSLRFDASYWGNTSGVNVGWPTFYWPSIPKFMQAYGEVKGVEFPPDSGAGQPGVYWFPSLVDPRLVQRSYARTGHYSNVNETRPNYHLLINTRARRVLLDHTRTATGVEFPAGNGRLITINAGEVVISAGAIHTPQFLQRSGIGPHKVLQAAGIETLVDLPGVGQNFHDHSGLIPMKIERTNASVSFEKYIPTALMETDCTIVPGLKDIHPNKGDLANNSDFENYAETLWAANRTAPQIAGWLPLTVDALARRLEQQDFASLLAPNAHPTVIAGYKAQMKLLAVQMRSSGTSWTRAQIQADWGIQGPVLMQSFQRGSINIKVTDPWNAEPMIDYNALSNPVEEEVFLNLINFIRYLNYNTSLSTLSPHEVVPGTNVTSEADLRACLRATLSPSDLHPVGSCSMLPLELGGCVDQTLRVYGVKSLRVVDGSVIPMVPSANTCQPIYAVAEKAADIIKSGI